MSKLWLPNTGMSKRIKFHDWEFWAEAGSIMWEQTGCRTAESKTLGNCDVMSPERALVVARQIGKDLLTSKVETSICRDRAEFLIMERALQEIEDLAKELLAKKAADGVVMQEILRGSV